MNLLAVFDMEIMSDWWFMVEEIGFQIMCSLSSYEANMYTLEL